MIIALSIVAGLAMAVLSFKVFFETIGEFFECVGEAFERKYFLFWSYSSGDAWSKLKLYAYLGFNTVVGFMTHYSLHKLWD